MITSAETRDDAGRPPVDGVVGPRPGGFSLPELLIVLIVVSVLSMLVVPYMEIVRYRMDGQARGAMTALVTAQRAAVKGQHDVVVAFDTVTAALRIHEDRNNNGAVDAGERVRHVVLDDAVRFGRGTAPSRTGEAVPSVTFPESANGMPVVRFHRNGSASREGTLYLTSSRSDRGEEYAKDTRAIEVNRATGRTTWYYYDPPQWKQGF